MMIIILPIVVLLLFIPFMAMQLTNEVNWSLFDFIIMGAMLTITGILGEIIFKKVKKYKGKIYVENLEKVRFVPLIEGVEKK